MAPSGPGGLAEEQQVLTDLTDQALIDHFVSLTEHATVWVALKLTGADATAENAKKLCMKLMKRLHPDKCKLPAADEAFRKLNHFRVWLMNTGVQGNSVHGASYLANGFSGRVSSSPEEPP